MNLQNEKITYDGLYIFPIIYTTTIVECTLENTIEIGLRLKSFNPVLFNFRDDNELDISIESNQAIYNVSTEKLCIITTSFKRIVSIKNKLINEDSEYLKKKIRLLFEIAHKKGHDTLVISEFRYFNPHVLRIFQEQILKFNGVFRNIIFSCNEKEYNTYKSILDP